MENIRNENFLGNTKVIVGNRYTDLVLETLGKVYIKTGNNSRLLNDLFTLLNSKTTTDKDNNIIIVNSNLEMENMEYPGDGYFIFNTLSGILYISYDLRYVALINSNDFTNSKYVKKSGDIMSGQLEITTVDAPLIVASSELVENLNVQYLNGFSDSDFAKKKVDEYIYGNWTFRGKGVSENNWIFKQNVRMYGDLVTSRSISSPEFASGFGGYGWRIDADTNTLTVDYLVVRKAMRVYEMVINKISATNGSIWVSNSNKCDSVDNPIILTNQQLTSIPNWTGSDELVNTFLQLIKSNTYYLPIPDSGENYDNYRVDSSGGTVTLTKEISGPSDINTTSTTFLNFKFIVYIINPEKLVRNPLFTGLNTLYNEALLTSDSDDADHIDLQSSIVLYYINKEIVVTKWNDTEPLEYSYVDTFDRDFPFFVIPKGNESTTGKLYSELFESAGTQENARNYVCPIYTYYKYFALKLSYILGLITSSNNDYDEGIFPSTPVYNLNIVTTNDDEYPLFKPGDILRCLKYQDGNIKYYDALVLSLIETRKFIVLRGDSVFDTYTEISYNEDGSVNKFESLYNNTQYNKTEKSYNPITGLEEPTSSSNTVESRLDNVASGDDMIQIGNIYDVLRLNAIYLTSCDDLGPYIDVISGLNRPDYSVIYDTPNYMTKELVYKSTKSKYYLLKESVADAPTTTEVIDGVQTTLYGTQYPTKTSLFESKDNKFRHSYTKTTRVRVGNLEGIYNEIFGNKQPYGYGLYGENVFLTGEFYLNNGTSVVDFSKEYIDLLIKSIEDDLLATGINIKDKVITITAETTKVISNSGDEIALFSIDPDTGRPYLEVTLLKADEIVANAGIIHNSLLVGTNFSVDSLGNLKATNANINGTITAFEGTIGGFTINSNSIYSGTYDSGTHMFLSTIELLFSNVDTEYIKRVAIGSEGSGILPGSSGLNIPVGIYSEAKHPDLENVGLYIDCRGAKRTSDSLLTGDIAIFIESGIIKGLRLSSRYVDVSNGPYTLDMKHNIYFIYSNNSDNNDVYLPATAKEGDVIMLVRCGTLDIYIHSNELLLYRHGDFRSQTKLVWSGFAILTYTEHMKKADSGYAGVWFIADTYNSNEGMS